MASGKYVVGLDVGSTTTKAVVMDLDAQILEQTVLDTGGYFEERAAAAVRRVLQPLGCGASEIAWTTATGYGRARVPNADQTVTELSCHARGAYHQIPRKIIVVDIGGQDNKILMVDADGRRGRSKMNRRCAAGTGAFIESAARQLGLECAGLQTVAAASDQGVEIGSFCTVFAATEIIEHLRRGSSKEAIGRGVLRAVALRVFEMGKFSGEVVLTGGVAEYFPVVAEELGKLSGCRVTIPPYPQTAGAIGAALYALRALEGSEKGGTVEQAGETAPGETAAEAGGTRAVATACKGEC
ncbi:MAG: acyl-CoA dehydratase activase [Acidobacteriota bacterium]